MEASILTTSAPRRPRSPDASWPRRSRQAHGKILERVGAHRVIFPERDMGIRVGHTITGRTIDYIQLDPGSRSSRRRRRGRSWARRSPRPRSGAGYGITVVCIKPAGGTFTYATPDTVVQEGDILVVAGETARAEAFADLA